MDFSEAYKSTGPAPVFSPDGKFLATVVDYRLVIRETLTLKHVQLYSCLDKIHKIEWSPLSTYVLCALHDRAVVQVCTWRTFARLNCPLPAGCNNCPTGYAILYLQSIRCTLKIELQPYTLRFARPYLSFH